MRSGLVRVVCDSGPLVAGAAVRDDAHRLATALLQELGPNLVVLDVVAAQVDALLRSRHGRYPARRFLGSLTKGQHSTAFMSSGLMQRAIELDSRYADLNLGLVDTSVMAYAERHRLPILTFDFRDFRATESIHGAWSLIVDEDALRRSRGG